MTGFTRKPVGSTVALRVKTVKRTDDATDGDAVAVDGLRITINDPNGTAVVSDAHLDVEGTGVYTYRWDTTGLARGTYKLIVKTIVSATGLPVIDDVRVELA